MTNRRQLFIFSLLKAIVCLVAGNRRPVLNIWLCSAFSSFLFVVIAIGIIESNNIMIDNNLAIHLSLAYASSSSSNSILPHFNLKSNPLLAHQIISINATNIPTAFFHASNVLTTIPVSPAVLPPRIVMVYSGTQHQGNLVNYEYRHSNTFGVLRIPKFNITANIPSHLVSVNKGLPLQFLIKGNPPSVPPPSSLSVDAYSGTGKSERVLDITGSSDVSFTVNLNSGRYILLAIATWLPETNQEKVAGYAMYSYAINVTT